MAEQKETVSISFKALSLPITIVLAGVMISGAIFFGLRSTGPSSSNGGGEVLEEISPTQVPGQQEKQPNQKAKTSIDDDPILGNRNTARAAIVEFSDYECPYCKRFRDQTLVQIKEEYIDTGKVILVYRDLPLGFHNPAAEREAMAAECARDQGGDAKYYQYHDQIFENTPGNGQGLNVDQLADLAGEVGLDGSKLKGCLDDNKFKKEVTKDVADAGKIGISGTPGFVIGKLDSKGEVEGVAVRGAQPYSVFQEVIEEQLKRE